MSAGELSELAAMIAAARQAWLQIERAADELDDDELDQRIACARLAILDSADRAQQLALRQLLDEAAA